MEIRIVKVPLDEIRSFRTVFLQERNFQFICNKCHDYGWADTYLFIVDGEGAGYGAVWGTDRREDRDTIFEYFLTRPFRHLADTIFPQFHALTAATYIECQSNDPLLASMLYAYAEHIHAEAVLFEDDAVTALPVSGVTFRKRSTDDDMGDDDSDYVLVKDGRIAASGGLMLNYNLPYADIYMNVREPFRRMGLGSLIVQELKREAYLMGRVPAARCNIGNHASKATLLKAGFRTCGFRLKGSIKAAP
ncbi:GNAT family N-acetyltransferase [Chitinophaga sp. XS-30]|uniref:GNAT family N-acetyltransferase n=1 Tax=Chitinophaga sp. XS-30 TaxID=2604421 RepID=UPI0011DDEE50|nr:GNAT family N-acetyltransferase [Chitinophaga sp. XS-30]QEH43030.1 N-acetyltransferase [Chitinophaga sp. XS-30]